MKKTNDNYKIVCILNLLKEREDYLNNALKLLNNAKEPISNLKINKKNQISA